MAKNKGNVVECLRSIRNHVGLHNASMGSNYNPEIRKFFEIRFKMIDAEVVDVLSRLKKIHELAVEQDNSDLLTLLNEVFEYGRDAY